MGFGDLKKKAGLECLNNFLLDKSYIVGYVPSQADWVVFQALSGAPPAELHNALRWYNHIKSYGKEASSFPGAPKPVTAYGPASGGGGDDDDDDIDLFGSDDDDEPAPPKKETKPAAKKPAKPAIIAKSTLVLDVKPWDDETDLVKLEENVRSVKCDGLLWGKSQLVPVAYGLKKLQIGAVIEDEKVSTDFLEESITAFEDYVQSMDIVAFNKL